MLSSLEGMLIALIMAFSPADRVASAAPASAPIAARTLQPGSACNHFLDMMARRNCFVRASRSRAGAAEASASFPSHLTWIVPTTTSMDRFQLAERLR